MQWIYFTKTLKELSLPKLVKFLKEAGLDGADMAVRPGFPIAPANVATALPETVKQFQDAGLQIPLLSLATNANDPEDPATRALFEQAAKNGVRYIKIGYFNYGPLPFPQAWAKARQALEGFAKLAEKTGVRAVHHTHSGNFLGGNCEATAQLLEGFDPHAIGLFVDTGHQAVGGGPFPLGLDMAGPWLALVAIKDMVWQQTPQGWRYEVAPAGTGIADWKRIGDALKSRHYDGIISLHGEYETPDLAARLQWAKDEHKFLQAHLQG